MTEEKNLLALLERIATVNEKIVVELINLRMAIIMSMQTLMEKDLAPHIEVKVPETKAPAVTHGQLGGEHE